MENYLKYLPILCVIVIYVLRMMEIHKKRNLVKGEIKERLTLLMFKLVGLFMVAAGVAEYLIFKRPFNPSWVVFGILVSTLSIYIRARAILALGRFWSLHVEIRANHLLVRTGPFRFVRHPAYASMALEIIAVGIILLAPISTCIALLFFVPVLRKRVTLEEKELIAKFGPSYLEYKKLVPAFIPFHHDE